MKKFPPKLSMKINYKLQDAVFSNYVYFNFVTVRQRILRNYLFMYQAVALLFFFCNKWMNRFIVKKYVNVNHVTPKKYIKLLAPELSPVELGCRPIGLWERGDSDSLYLRTYVSGCVHTFCAVD